jgi:hypothetical protein
MQFVAVWPIWLVWICVVVSLWTAFEAGRFLRRRGLKNADRAIDTKDIGFLVPSAFGLLSLLIGFTFSLALSRYESRRDLIVAEAAQVRLASLRADLLPSPTRQAMADMLRAYVDSRLDFFEVGSSPSDIRAAQAASERLQAQMWSQLRALAADDGFAPHTRAFADSLDQMITIGMQRETAAVERIPARVLEMLFMFAILALAILGHGTGAIAGRPWTPMLAFIAIVSSALVLIVDLDRPRTGDIQVSQAPMLEVRTLLQVGAPAPTPEQQSRR